MNLKCVYKRLRVTFSCGGRRSWLRLEITRLLQNLAWRAPAKVWFIFIWKSFERKESILNIKELVTWKTGHTHRCKICSMCFILFIEEENFSYVTEHMKVIAFYSLLGSSPQGPPLGQEEMASSCNSRVLGWILGKISSSEMLLSTGTAQGSEVTSTGGV